MIRNRSLDIAKGMAICLMVLGHSYSEDNMILWIINSFHMPFFFIASGILYADKFANGVNFHVGKMMLKLLVPYAIFEFLFCVYLALCNTSEPFWKVLSERLYYTVTLEGNNATWFLACMFVTEVLFFIALKYIHKKAICICLCLFLALLGAFADVERLPIICERSMIYIGFLAVGYYAKDLFLKKPNWFTGVLIFGLFVILAVCKNICHIAWVSVLSGMVTGVTGSYLLVQISSWLQRSKLSSRFEFFGRNTIVVLCIHIFVIEALRLTDYKLFDSLLPRLGLAEGFVLSAIVLCIMRIIIPICNRYGWFLFGRPRELKKAQ